MAESSKSAGSADSYIGSLISLTSKCEIRYEGVLYNIDTENSTIGLQNVSSYGTEGRKKDGQQIPPSDKVYEYILFRGSDIKDLQVKSTPPIQTERQIHSDPAIIQSHYACAPSVSSTSAPVGGGEPSALPRTTYPNVLPTYQPGAHLGSLGSSSAIQNADGTSISMPMNWQGYYDSSNVLPHAQQQSIPFQPPSTVPVPLLVQNQLQYPEVRAHLSSSMINMSERVAPAPPLIPTANVVPSNFSPVSTPAHFSTLSTTDITSSLSVKTSLPSHRAPTTANVLNMSPLPSYNQVTNVVSAPIYGNVGSAPTVILPTQSVPYSASFISGSTSGPLLTISPTLLTPNQLTQSGPPLPSSTQILYPNQNDMEVPILASSNPSTSVCNPLFQVPLLPLPLSSQQLDESVGNSRSSNGEVRVSHAVAPQHPAPQFTEEFDFIAMNEKFKKDEVWGKLGKAKKRDKTEGTEHNPVPNIGGGEEYDQVPKFDTKPVYIKDEFFDTLSCNSPARGGRNGQSRFSERMKLDTETFGDFEQRSYLGRGGHFIGRGGNYRGSYNRGRGYGYGGRGRGGHMPF